MKSLFAVIAAAVYGLSLRILVDLLGGAIEIMSISLLILTPVFLGFITVALISHKQPISGLSAFFLPWLTILVLLIVTIILNIEGMICWIMIYPLASIIAGIGGIIANNIYSRKHSVNKKNDPGTLMTSLILVLPLFIGTIEGERTFVSKEITIKREVNIPASTEKVWEELININEVNHDDKKTSIANFLGFPKHLRTTLDTAAVGGKRVAYYEKGLYFEEEITVYEPGKRLILNFNIDPSKIPSNVMDEHIIIGGKHVDILKDTYVLEQLSNGNSKLTLSSDFTINSPINWYAGIWAKYLMSDILNGELNLIKQRAISGN